MSVTLNKKQAEQVSNTLNLLVIDLQYEGFGRCEPINGSDVVEIINHHWKWIKKANKIMEKIV